MKTYRFVNNAGEEIEIQANSLNEALQALMARLGWGIAFCPVD